MWSYRSVSTNDHGNLRRKYYWIFKTTNPFCLFPRNRYHSLGARKMASPSNCVNTAFTTQNILIFQRFRISLHRWSNFSYTICVYGTIKYEIKSVIKKMLCNSTLTLRLTQPRVFAFVFVLNFLSFWRETLRFLGVW